MCAVRTLLLKRYLHWLRASAQMRPMQWTMRCDHPRVFNTKLRFHQKALFHSYVIGGAGQIRRLIEVIAKYSIHLRFSNKPIDGDIIPRCPPQLRCLCHLVAHTYIPYIYFPAILSRRRISTHSGHSSFWSHCIPDEGPTIPFPLRSKSHVASVFLFHAAPKCRFLVQPQQLRPDSQTFSCAIVAGCSEEATMVPANKQHPQQEPTIQTRRSNGQDLTTARNHDNL